MAVGVTSLRKCRVITNYMGQAKKRGTYEQRVEQALDRNDRVVEHFVKTNDLEGAKFLRKVGVQRGVEILMRIGFVKQGQPK